MEKEMVQHNIHPILSSYLPVAEGIAKTFGEFCEVVLHDISDLSSTIIAIYNGKVTGRKLGSPVNNLGLEVIRQGEKGEDLLINYLNTSVQKDIKSTSMIIRDEKNEIIGCLCINLDLTYLTLGKSTIEGIMSVDSNHENREDFPLSINHLENRIIEKAIEIVGVPVSLMKKDDREKFISYLDKQGIFLIKDAVQKVANMLNISKYTLYNYIDKS